MKNLTTTLLLLAVALSVHAQKHANDIQLFFTPKYYLNKANVENDGFTDSYITTKNNFNKEFGVAYYHRFPSGVILSHNVSVGWRSQDVGLTYRLDDLDPKAVQNLKDFSFYTEYQFATIYISNKVMVGYSYALPKGKLGNWRIEAQAGLALMAASKNETTIQDAIVRYRYDDGSGGALKSIAMMTYNVDDGNRLSVKESDHVSRKMGVVYIGMRKDMNKSKVFSSMNIGVEFNWEVFRTSDDFNMLAYETYRFSTTGNDYDTYIDKYQNKNINIGLRIAVGLWR